MLLRTIIQGRLEFNKKRSYDKALEMYRHRFANYYGEKVILKEEEEIFNEDELNIDIPRTDTMTTNKYWKNTVELMQYLAQFAIAGRVGMWIVDSGRIIEHYNVEPESEKSTVKQFNKGKTLSKQKGKEENAIKALNKVIKKYDKHSQAYERRGYINFQLENYEDALYDFDKSLSHYKHNPEAYYGRALVHMHNDDNESAIEDLESASWCAVAHQEIYWQSRRLLGFLYYKTGNNKKAIFNLKLFVNRNFDEDDVNFNYKKWAYYHYGLALMAAEDYREAESTFGMALTIDDDPKMVSNGEILKARGVARKKKGGKGFLKDWKEAAGLGSKEAKKLLEEHS